MEHTEKPRYYFAAMNTANGFCGKFKEIFGEVQELYIIKGGPGTGKSRFISEMGKKAEEQGRSVEYFFCSSDPRSLDGVIFTDHSGTGRIGIIDGTAPHSYEPVTPGAKDKILNFGEFWNENELSPARELISALGEAKSELYSSAYSYLGAIGRLDSVTEGYMLRTVNLPKMNSAVERLLRGLPTGSGYHETLRIRSAISCDGTVTLETYSQFSPHNYAILDRFFAANTFMKALKARLTELRQPVVISYSPFFPDTPDAIYVPGGDMSFYIGSEGGAEEKTVNMRRFTAEEHFAPYKPKLRAISRARRELLTLLHTDMTCIRNIHSEIEEIYISAMDFVKKEEFTRAMAQKIFG
ncbi:MAG: hypothetical protein IKB34_01590 [Clostridia bacterium]|nr:hypothetical protein [Clostridia bacterium]